MPFLTQGPEGEKVLYGAGQSNRNFIAIVVILMVIVAGAYYYFSRQTADIHRDEEEIIVDAEPKTEIAFVYYDAIEIPMPLETREMLLLFYPGAQMSSYVSADSPEEVEGWYRAKLKAEDWQEVDGIFSEWEKDGFLLGLEVGLLTEEETIEIGVEGVQTYILLYRDRVPESEPEPEPEPRPEPKHEPEPEAEKKPLIPEETKDKKTYTLSVTKEVLYTGHIYTSPHGLECPPGRINCSHKFEAGQEVIITIAPRSGTDILLWTGDCSGKERKCTVVMDSDKSVTAFISSVIKSEYTLKVLKSGTGGGKIKSVPEGISCEFQKFTPATRCEHNFNMGSTVILEAIADSDSKFIGWQTGGHPIECTEVDENKCKILIFQDKYIRPQFEAFDLFINVISPKEGAVLNRGDSLEIKWEQGGLEDKKIDIYLQAHNENKGQIWPLKAYSNNLLGNFAIVENYPAEEKSYLWKIPLGLKNYFQEEPSFYKIRISHIDYGQPMLSAWSEYIEIR